MADITEYTEQQIREFYVRGKNEFYRISISEQEETDYTNYIFADGVVYGYSGTESGATKSENELREVLQLLMVRDLRKISAYIK